MALSPTKGTVRFGLFALDRGAAQLTRNGTPIRLPQQPLRLLSVLLESPGQIVTREELRQRLWPSDVFIDFDHGLNKSIQKLRDSLGDSADSPRYIETVPRVGYRFIAPVRGEDYSHSVEVETVTPQILRIHNPTPEVVREENRIATKRPGTGGRLPIWAVAGICLLLVVGVSCAIFLRRPSPQPLLRVVSASSLTRYPGDEREPAVSPDGSLVAFSWSGPSRDNYDIYVLKPGAEQPLRLTHDPAPDGFPTWSPGGDQIAFVRRIGDTAQLVVIPALGGPERVLGQFPRMGGDLDFSQHPVMSWNGDGAAIIYSGQSGAGGKYRLFALSVSTGEVRAISTPGPEDVGDSSPALSRDGRFLAFVRYLGPLNGRVMIQPLNPGIVPAGEPMEVRSSSLSPRSPMWLEDGQRLLFADPTGIFEWDRGRGSERIYAPDGVLGSASLAVDRAGRQQLVVALEREDPDIWAIPLNASGTKATGPPAIVQQSTANENHPDYSPDGHRIAFASARSGSMEIWLANADGSNPRQLTHLGGHVTSYPRWSPDGTKIAFHARLPDVAQVYVVDVREGEPRQVTHQIPGLALATWSRDGQSLYASTLLGGRATIYRLPAGGGPLKRLWDGSLLQESVDGRYALYFKPSQAGIFRRSLAGDPTKNPEELLVPDFWPTNQLGGYESVSGGVYYVSGDAWGKPGPFRYFDYTSRKSIDVAPPVPGLGSGFSIAPDRRYLAFAASSQVGGDLLLLSLQ